MLQDTETAGVVANGAARARTQGQGLGSVESGLARLLGPNFDPSQLSVAVDNARNGSPQSITGPEGERIVLIPVENRGIAGIVAPASFGDIHRLQRRAAVADRTAGVSHELANALGAITGWTKLAKSGQQVPEALDLIERGAQSAWTTARSFLVDARPEQQTADGVPNCVDLTSLLNEVRRLIAPLAATNHVRVIGELEEGLYAAADRGSAWTVLWNLATNAVQAMPTGGTLRIGLTRDNGNVKIAVQDTGSGMPEEIKARIFEPYFTTKSDGAGIGLSLVRKTIESLGGTIVVHSTPNVGTRFEVTLPRASQPASPVQKRKRTSGVFHTDHIEGRFLVVDDDEILREMISTALQMRGATVVAVESAEAALETSGPFDATIVDLLLTDVRGDALIAGLRDRNVVQRALLVTGTEIPEDLAANGRPDMVLRKPFDLEALFATLHELIETTPSRSSHSA